VRLFSYWRSSSAWRVRIALNYKNLEHEIVPVHLLRDGGGQHEPGFLEYNPMGQVPVLEVQDGEKTLRLTQSMAILEYLEEKAPTPPLLPADPISRARARQLAEMINSGIQPLQNLALRQALRAQGFDPDPVVRTFVENGLAAVEGVARSTAGRFLVGDQPTFADAYLIPQLYASRRLYVDVGAFAALLRIESNCATLPAFQAAHPDAQPDREVPPP
jgi:maleylpyruvate isomerase